MTKRRHHRRNRKELIRRRRRTALCCFLALVCVAGVGFAAMHFFKKDPSEDKVAAKSAVQAQNLNLQEQKVTKEKTQDESSGNESTGQEEAAGSFGNLKRNVENTATEDNHLENGLAICMYHYVYTADNPPETLNSNFIEAGALRKELQYLVDNEYFFPTWEEVRQYIDGELLLPKKSIVLTFDDGAKSFLNHGLPICEELQIPVTSFLITSENGKSKVKKYSNEYLSWQSHSHNMHRGGGNIGHGGIFPVMSNEDAVADLKKSIKICGNGEAFAYPYGDYNDSCVQAVKDAGFLCAVTTEYGKSKPGDDPLLLPRVRMLGDQSLAGFKSAIE